MKETDENLYTKQSVKLLPDSYHVLNEQARTVERRTSVGYKLMDERVNAGIYKYTEEIIRTHEGSVKRHILVHDTLGIPEVRGVVIENGELKELKGFDDDLTDEQKAKAAQGLFDLFTNCDRYLTVNKK